MRLSWDWLGLAAMVAVVGCGDDAGSGEASDDTGSTSATTVSVPDPTSVGDDTPTPPPDPDSSSGGETGMEPDLPPPSMGDCTDLAEFVQTERFVTGLGRIIDGFVANPAD